MPARYVRIMDVSLECIDATNRKREHDIEDVRNQLARLKKKKKVFEAEYQKAKMQCNELRAKLGRKRETPEISRTHPLLKEFVSNNESANNPNDVILAQFDENLAVKRPDDERKFISVLLGQISSVYD
jgi:predicted phage gp36 major capsid-like protein